MMLQDKELDEMTQVIVNIYNQIEIELLKDIAKRFNTYSTVRGSLEWYLSMLKDMNVLDNNAIKIIAKYSDRSEKYIKDMLKKSQFANFDKETINKAHEQGMAKVAYEDLIKSKVFKDIFDNSYMEINESLRLIQTKALESVREDYISILNKSYIDVSSGTYSYDESIRNGIKKMAKKGIIAIRYKRKDGTIVNFSMEAAVRRDTLTSVHRVANESLMKSIELTGNNYVDVSKHLGARVSLTNPIADHAGWQGKQYQIKGESEEYKNFEKTTGYGDIQGFGGVNCRHRMYNFFPGFSEPYHAQFDEKENRIYYENTQKLRKLERDMRKLKKERDCLNEVEDYDDVKQLNLKIKDKAKAIDIFCEKNGLKRDHTREVVGDV